MKSATSTFLLAIVFALSGCATNQGPAAAQSQARQPTLVGAWEVTSRPGADGNSFEGKVRSSNRDLQDRALRQGSASLNGQRIQVRAF